MSIRAKPTVIFVPGAWHSPESFRLVGDLLDEAGYRTDYVHLPSVGPEQAHSGIDEDISRIRSHIIHAVEAGQDVIVVVHSYGGVPTQDAVKGLDKELRLQQRKDGGVCHLFFCCSFIIDQGSSVMSAFGNTVPDWYRLADNGLEFITNTPEATFYNDLDEIQAKAAAKKLRPHSSKTTEGIVQYAAWRHVPSTYLYCLKDQALPFEVQKMMVEQTAGGVGVQFRTETLDAGHSPFLSMPKEMSEAIRRAAGERI